MKERVGSYGGHARAPATAARQCLLYVFVVVTFDAQIGLK